MTPLSDPLRKIQKPLPKNGQMSDLHTMVENKVNGLKRVANSELLHLFWKIGNQLNQLIGKSETNITQEISRHLARDYGLFFSEKGLTQMRLFSHSFPEFAKPQEYLHFLSWNHVLVLLKIKNQDERRYYLILKIKLGLSVSELEEAITLHKYEDYLKTKKKNQFHIPPITLGLLAKNDQTKPDLFKPPLLSRFRTLLEPKKTVGQPTDHLPPYQPIVELVENYRVSQNNCLNTHFNLLLWEVGKSLGQKYPVREPASKTDASIKRVPPPFQEADSVFSTRQLHLIKQFAECFPVLEEASKISYLLTWEHLLILLNLPDVNRRFFYINTVMEKGLSVDELKRLISSPPPESPSNSPSTSQTLISLREMPTRKTISTRTQGGVTITSIDLELTQEAKTIPNIFANRHLKKLLHTKRGYPLGYSFNTP